MLRRTRKIAAAGLFVGTVLSGAALAREDSFNVDEPPASMTVEKCHQKGQEAMREGRFKSAITYLDCARAGAKPYNLHGEQPPQLLGEVALAEVALGDWISADSHLQSSLSHPEDPWVQQNHADLWDVYMRVQGHLGDLMVTGPKDAIVDLDGRVIGKLPAEWLPRLPVGKYKIALRRGYTAPPCLPWKEIEILPGKRLEVDLRCAQ